MYIVINFVVYLLNWFFLFSTNSFLILFYFFLHFINNELIILSIYITYKYLHFILFYLFLYIYFHVNHTWLKIWPILFHCAQSKATLFQSIPLHSFLSSLSQVFLHFILSSIGISHSVQATMPDPMPLHLPYDSTNILQIGLFTYPSFTFFIIPIILLSVAF